MARVKDLPANWALLQVGGVRGVHKRRASVAQQTAAFVCLLLFLLIQEAGPEAEAEVLPAEAEATAADPYLAPGVMVEDLLRRLQALVSEALAQLHAPAAAAAQAGTSTDQGPLPAQPQPLAQASSATWAMI